MMCEDDEPPDRYYLELRLDEVKRAIALAKVRCLSDRELIDKIFDNYELGDFLAIRALKERGSISQQNQAHLFMRLSEALADDFAANSLRLRGSAVIAYFFILADYWKSKKLDPLLLLKPNTV